MTHECPFNNLTFVNYEVENPEFRKAINFVAEKLPSLINEELVSITLIKANANVPGAMYTDKWHGLHIRVGPEASEIYIRNGKLTMWEFLDTLIHELVHVYQYASGSTMRLTHAQMEEQADGVAYQVLREMRRKK